MSSIKNYCQQSTKDSLLIENLKEFSPIVGSIKKKILIHSDTQETSENFRVKEKSFISEPLLTNIEVLTLGEIENNIESLAWLEAEINEIQRKFDKNMNFLEINLKRNRDLIERVQDLELRKEMKKKRIRKEEVYNNCKIW